MTELEEIKQKRMEELRNAQAQQQAEEEAEQKIDSAVRQMLTEKARERLGNVKLVNKELYLKAVQAMAYLQQSGGVGKLDDAQLRALLKKIGGKKEISIRRK